MFRKKPIGIILIIFLAACTSPQATELTDIATQTLSLEQTALPSATATQQPPTPTTPPTPSPSPTIPAPTATPGPVEFLAFTMRKESGFQLSSAVLSFVYSDGSGLVSPSLFEPFYDTNLSTGKYLAWSPDGHYLAFDGADEFIPCDLPECYNSINYGTYIFDYLENTIIRHVVSTQTNVSWSPDSQRLVLSIHEKGDSDVDDLYILDVNSGQLKQLTSGPSNDLYPSWSPDGEWIAFTRFNPDPEIGCNVFPVISDIEQCHLGNLYMVRPDGSDLQLLYELVFIYNIVVMDYYNAPAWSPDSEWLAFLSRNENEDEYPDISIINVETGETELVSGENGLEMDPTWGPKGEILALYGSHDGNYGIYLWDLKDKNFTYLTSGTYPVWSWSGAHIAFTSANNLFVMNADGTNIVEITDETYQSKPAWQPSVQP
ncbi:MAG TPA: DPP IV N-terminal domain-containing protein [Anaerolineales bacterium]|nr:DPP IV N-terminal domain-containing protein [Anaerolineales bacterium]